MLAVAELTFLRQFFVWRSFLAVFTAGGPTGEIMKDLLTTEGVKLIYTVKRTREVLLR
jgi:membrane-bound metal-dependent hydrolase YbcI (DUF457 family)